MLFGSLLGTVAAALLLPRAAGALSLPLPLFRLGQALVGAVIGELVQLSTLSRLASDAASVLVVTLGTLVISVVAGRALAVHPEVSVSTGACAMVAGGASGVVAIAPEVGADERIVAVSQYLRVLLVVVSLPLVAALAFPGTDAGRTPVGVGAPLGSGLLFTALAVGGGLGLHRVVRMPAGALLLPLGVAAVLSTTGLLGDTGVPVVATQLGYLLIGVAVGLRFDRASLRGVVRVLPWSVAAIVVVIGSSAALGLVLSAATGVDRVTAYLATTPGGLFAVLPLAAGSGSDVTYVLSVQVIRLVVMLAVTPLLGRWLQRR